MDHSQVSFVGWIENGKSPLVMIMIKSLPSIIVSFELERINPALLQLNTELFSTGPKGWNDVQHQCDYIPVYSILPSVGAESEGTIKTSLNAAHNHGKGIGRGSSEVLPR
jgi:hypothetical protein